MSVLFSVCPVFSEYQDLVDMSACLLTRLTLPTIRERGEGSWLFEHTDSLIALHAEPCQCLQMTITDTTTGLSVPHLHSPLSPPLPSLPTPPRLPCAVISQHSPLLYLSLFRSFIPFHPFTALHFLLSPPL